MKKLITFYLAFLVVFCSLSLKGQTQNDTIKTLIISEINKNGRSEALYRNYLELTNMGTDPVDLSQFSLDNVNPYVQSWKIDENGDIQLAGKVHDRRSLFLEGTLQPGESWTVIAVQDGMNPVYYPMRPVQSIAMLDKADAVVHFLDWFTGGRDTYYGFVKPEYEMFGFDSVDVNKDFIDMRSIWGYALVQHFDDNTSYLVDQVSLSIDWTTNKLFNNADMIASMPIAGVPNAADEYNLVRKFSVKQGNNDWDDSRGITEGDSEWLLVPSTKNVGHNRMPFTTFDTHGDFHLDYSSTTLDFNEGTGVLTVPWGTERNDSIIKEISLGEGMAWYYVVNSVFADSAYNTCRNGDMLELYACGNTLEKESWTIEVAPPTEDMNIVVPKNTIRFDAIGEDDFDGQYWATDDEGLFAPPYYVSKGNTIDTIKFVPFGTRADTLFKYVEWAPNATAEIVTVDGANRADLMEGDLLKIKSQNGSEKSYYIEVEAYEELESDNVNLALITWPDRPGYYLEGWGVDGMSDTIPGFSIGRSAFVLTLPYGTTNVPALFARTEDLNAVMKIDPAVSLKGGTAERTTTITVTSESDTLVQAYTILFNVENPFKQKYVGEPVFSEFLHGIYWAAGAVEILNPTDELIDLSGYMIVRSQKTNPAEVISAPIGNWLNRFMTYVPGYKWTSDPAVWDTDPGILEVDLNVSSVVEPGDVFVMSKLHHKTQPVNEFMAAQSDVIFNAPDVQADGYANPWGEAIGGNGFHNDNCVGMPHLNNPKGSYFLFKILNDSILSGDKNIYDPADFKLIDAFGDNVWPWVEQLDGVNLAANATKIASRKAGNYLPASSLGTGWSADSTSWWNTGMHNDGTYHQATNMVTGLGSHNFGPVTIHQSTVSSLIYAVDAGFEGDLNINGVSKSETVEQFYANLIKADAGQVLTVLSGVDASEKALTDDIANNDQLVVTSANSASTTKYAILTTPLDSDAVLTPAYNPTNIVIETTAETGLIKGIQYGAILSEVMDSLKVPDRAIASVVNQLGELVPMQIMNYDSIYVNTLIGDLIYVKVVAEDGTTITYKFSPESLSSDAFVISSIYAVDQDARTISGVPMGTAVKSFWRNIEVVKGATSLLTDKTDFERQDGLMNFDDKLTVVSEDGSVSVTYYLNFIEEVDFDNNQAPVVTASADIDGREAYLSATVEDDGLPFGATLTYQWNLVEGGEENVTIESPTSLETKVTFTADGTYVLQLAVSDGERETVSALTVTVNTVGVSESKMPALSLYPNPASDRIYVELRNTQNQKSTLNIYDITGKNVYVKQLAEFKTMIELELKSGIYLVRVTSTNETFTQQLNILK